MTSYYKIVKCCIFLVATLYQHCMKPIQDNEFPSFMAYHIPGCAPTSRLVWGQWRGQTTDKTGVSGGQTPELQPSDLEADKDGYTYIVHVIPLA